jgi:hypothetical protein
MGNVGVSELVVLAAIGLIPLAIAAAVIVLLVRRKP